MLWYKRPRAYEVEHYQTYMKGAAGGPIAPLAWLQGEFLTIAQR